MPETFPFNLPLWSQITIGTIILGMMVGIYVVLKRKQEAYTELITNLIRTLDFQSVSVDSHEGSEIFRSAQEIFGTSSFSSQLTTVYEIHRKSAEGKELGIIKGMLRIPRAERTTFDDWFGLLVRMPQTIPEQQAIIWRAPEVKIRFLPVMTGVSIFLSAVVLALFYTFPEGMREERDHLLKILCGTSVLLLGLIYLFLKHMPEKKRQKSFAALPKELLDYLNGIELASKKTVSFTLEGFSLSTRGLNVLLTFTPFMDQRGRFISEEKLIQDSKLILEKIGNSK